MTVLQVRERVDARGSSAGVWRLAPHGTPTILRSTMNVNYRRQVVRKCRGRGWNVHPEALEILLESNDLEATLNSLQDVMKTQRTITKDLLQLQPETEEEPDFYFTDAFQTPRLSFDRRNQTFKITKQQGEILGTAQDKMHVLSDRYDLIQQRLLRLPEFRKKKFHQSSDVHTISTVGQLLGTTQAEVLLLAVLVPARDTYVLEDRTGQVPVDLSQAVISDDSFVTEYSILLFHGYMDQEIFRVNEIVQPLLEPRKASLKVIQSHVHHPNYQLPQKVVSGDVVLVQNINLDDPKLDALLAQFHGLDDVLLVVTGKFYHRFQDYCDRFEQCSHPVALLPSDRDHPMIWPIPAVAARFNSKVISLSNPARLHWGNREIVICGTDLLQVHSSLPLTTNESLPATERLVRQVLGQGHLGLPAFWNYSHALSLYPLPDCLMLVGNSEYCDDINDCQILQSGDDRFARFNVDSAEGSLCNF